MKRTGFLFLMFAAVSAISCLKEETPQVQDQGMYFTFEAAREALSAPDAPQTPAVQQVATKTVLVDNNKVQWVKNDRVGVYNGINENGADKVSAVDSDGATYKAEVNSGLWKKSWEFAAQNDGAKGVFKASKEEFDASGDEYMLLYPRNWTYVGYNENGVKRVRFWVGDYQNAVKDSFDPSVCYAVAKTNSLKSSPENPIVFKNVMSLLKFTVPAELSGQITEITVWGKNSEHLGGEIICDYSGDEPVVLPFKKVYSDSNKGKTAVGLKDTNGMASGYYYLAVCPGDLSGLVVSVTSKSGRNYRREKTAAVTLRSGVIYDMGEIEAETYNVKVKGVSQLPYVFSFSSATGSGASPRFVTAATKGGDSVNQRYLTMTDNETSSVFLMHQEGNSTYPTNYIEYWAYAEGHDGATGKMFLPEGVLDNGKYSYLKLSVPLNIQMPENFRVTFGMFANGNGCVKDWKLQYSADDKNWKDAGTYSLTAWGCYYYNIDVKTDGSIKDYLYLRWVPNGTVGVNGSATNGYNNQIIFWGAVVISETTVNTTPSPAGAIYFESFDKIVGGVDYLAGGKANGRERLGHMTFAHGSIIDSWTTDQKNGLTGSHVVKRPGYAQIGRPNDNQGYNWGNYKNNIGSLVTPKLQAGTLNLSFKAMVLRDPTLGRTNGKSFKDEVSGTMLYDAIIVNVKGGGTFSDETTSKTISGVSYTQFGNYELTILNATSETQVEFTSPKTDVAEDNNTTWFIDDICVMKDGADTDVARTIQVANPDLKIALPKKSASNGKLVIMVPGGGYSGMNLVGDREGDGWASYYNERGIACATLRYTLPAGNCLLPVNDLKNAIKYIREHSAELGVNEIGVHGFSAGGHLASTGATHFTGELRPDFQILFYPVITLRNATHNGSRNQFLGSNPSKYMLDLYSNELQVTKDTPKAFVMYYVPDTVVPQATNGAAYVEALKAHDVPVKTLIYDTCYPDNDTQSGHGWWERDTRIDGKHVKEHLSDWLQAL